MLRATPRVVCEGPPGGYPGGAQGSPQGVPLRDIQGGLQGGPVGSQEPRPNSKLYTVPAALSSRNYFKVFLICTSSIRRNLLF